MKIHTYPDTLIMVSTVIVGTVMVTACGGSGSGSSTTPTPASKATTIDVASVTAGIPEISALVPICSATKAVAQGATAAVNATPLLGTLVDMSGASRAAAFTSGPKASGPVKPTDTLGSCGGRMTYPEYSHANGITTATLSFVNYCSSGSTAGTSQIVNGNIAYVVTGTPTASGPITTSTTANSPAGVSFVTQDAKNTVLSSQMVAFTNYNYTVGVPGGKPTQAKPNSYGIDELSITDKLTGKTYRESGYKVVYFQTASGGSQYTFSGRGYRSNGDYFDVSTTTPWVTDSSGATVSGAITFTGANGSAAVATFVPGKVSQATMTVNGTPLTGMPACK